MTMFPATTPRRSFFNWHYHREHNGRAPWLSIWKPVEFQPLTTFFGGNNTARLSNLPR